MHTLAKLVPGEKAIIQGFTDDELSLKLMEMGCLPGEIVEFKKTAPLGCPIEIAISGYLLSMRKSEAEKVIIQELKA
jgi:ferrous iron transport protein A